MDRSIIIDRHEAGKQLGEKLMKFRNSGAVVIAIPRGGVPVAFEIAFALDLPLDVVLTKKIGHPLSPEFAIGAVSAEVAIVEQHPEISSGFIDEQVKKIKADLQLKHQLYGSGRAPEIIRGKTVILVDDGITTGHTMISTIALIKKHGAAMIIVAVPVLPLALLAKMKQSADEFYYLLAPQFFPAVSTFYETFPLVGDEEVIKMLQDIYQLQHNGNHR
jgi:predicted phosphoribosyltransferase